MQGMGTLSTKMDRDTLYSMIDSTATTFDANQSEKPNVNNVNQNKGKGRNNQHSNQKYQTNTSNNKNKTQGANWNNNSRYIQPDIWAKMSHEERQKHIEVTKKCNHGTPSTVSVNNSSSTSIATPTTPSTGSEESTTNSTPPQPGSTICCMMLQLEYQVQQEITINGVTYVVKNAHVKYHVQNHNRISTGSLIDGGANGGLVPS